MRVRAVALLAGIVGCVSVAHAIRVEDLLGGGRLVAYAPLGFDPHGAARPRAASLRADAESLHHCGFRAVTTYGSSRALAPVCRFFKRAGFRTVLVGVWDPRDRDELGRASALRRCADGYVVGTEGLTSGRYALAELTAAIGRLRRRTGRPATTRETLAAYAKEPGLLTVGDWLFPTVHPWYAGERDAQDACGWTIAVYRDLVARVPATHPVVIAETGLPTDGALATSEFFQRAFFYCLETRGIAFAHFEAFDQPWKSDGTVAPHWGLFRADGSPKLWAAQHFRPSLGVRRTRRAVQGRVGGVPARMVRVVAYVLDGRWTLAGRASLGRRGKWRIRVPPGRPVALLVGASGWTPPAALERLPAIDRVQVLVRRDLPAM